MKQYLQGDPWPLGVGVGGGGAERGFLGPFCSGGKERVRKSRKTLWEPQNGGGMHTPAGEEERERQAQCERGWAFQRGRKTAQPRQSWNQKKRDMGHRVTPGPLDGGRAVVPLLGWPAQAQGASSMMLASQAKASPTLAANGTNQALR